MAGDPIDDLIKAIETGNGIGEESLDVLREILGVGQSKSGTPGRPAPTPSPAATPTDRSLLDRIIQTISKLPETLQQSAKRAELPESLQNLLHGLQPLRNLGQHAGRVARSGLQVVQSLPGLGRIKQLFSGAGSLAGRAASAAGAAAEAGGGALLGEGAAAAAAALGAIAAPAAAVVGAFAAVGAAGVAFLAFPVAVAKAAEVMLESQRKLTTGSNQIAAIFQNSDRADFFRQGRVGAATADSTSGLASSLQDLKTALEPMTVALTNISNKVMTSLVNVATRAANAVSGLWGNLERWTDNFMSWIEALWNGLQDTLRHLSTEIMGIFKSRKEVDDEKRIGDEQAKREREQAAKDRDAKKRQFQHDPIAQFIGNYRPSGDSRRRKPIGAH